MSIFNDNLRFMCKKMGLSQQKLADQLGVPRGKVAGYFYTTQAKPDFHQKLSAQFQLDLGRFLTIKMDEFNYESFFVLDKVAVVNDPKASYSKLGIIDLLIKAKNTLDRQERDQLIDEAISQSARIMEENSKLKDDLVASLRKESD